MVEYKKNKGFHSGGFMLIVDAHCDTLSEVLEKKSIFFKTKAIWILRGCMKQKKRTVFAVFVKPETKLTPWPTLLKQIDILYQAEKEYSRYLEVAYNTEDIERILSEGKAAAILSIEGGEALSRDLGYCVCSIGWESEPWGLLGTTETRLPTVFSTIRRRTDPFGKSVVSEMNRLGMVIDVSHLNKKGFWDVIEQSEHPIIALIPMPEALCGHRRNLDDRQL